MKDTGLAETPCSIYRDKRVRDQLTPKRGKLTLEDFRSAFFDDYGSPWSVCRPPRPNNRGNLVATSAMILMRPGEGHLEACPMPALNKQLHDLHADARPHGAGAGGGVGHDGQRTQ